MKVVAFAPSHLATLNLQSAQAYFGQQLADAEYGRSLVESGPCFTALDGNTVLACAGVHEIWDNRAMAWALISQSAGRHMVSIHRAVRGFLMQAKYRRIEATVDAGFEEGRRWAQMLGFVCETPQPMRAYTPAGGDCYLYAKVK